MACGLVCVCYALAADIPYSAPASNAFAACLPAWFWCTCPRFHLTFCLQSALLRTFCLPLCADRAFPRHAASYPLRLPPAATTFPTSCTCGSSALAGLTLFVGTTRLCLPFTTIPDQHPCSATRFRSVVGSRLPDPATFPRCLAHCTGGHGTSPAQHNRGCPAFRIIPLATSQRPQQVLTLRFAVYSSGFC